MKTKMVLSVDRILHRLFSICRCDLALRMLDLYKDEPKKVFKIMDVIIDQDIDPNMKKPLHLWYYQDKVKQGKLWFMRLLIFFTRSNFYLFLSPLLDDRLKLITEKQTRKRKQSKVVPYTMSFVLQEGRPYRKQTHYTVPLPSQPAKPSTSGHRRPCNTTPVPPVPPNMPVSNTMNVHPFNPNSMHMPHAVRSMSAPATLPFPPIPVMPHPVNAMPTPPEIPISPSNVPLRLPQLLQPAMPPYPMLTQHSINGIFPTPITPGQVPQGSFVVKGGRAVQHNVKNCARPTLISSKSNKNKW